MPQKGSESKSPTFLKWCLDENDDERKLFRRISLYVYTYHKLEWTNLLGYGIGDFKLWEWTLGEK